MKLLHITIHTAKFEEEISFYQEIAGLTIVNDMRRFGANIVFLADAEGDTCVEVIKDMEAEASGNEHLSIGFSADDVEQLKADLKAKGIETSPMITPNPHVKFFFVTDPAGVKVQFI